MKHLGWLHQSRSRSRSRSGLFVALTTVSLLAHGVVLGLPWPAPDPGSELPPPESADGAAVMDVAILPSTSGAPPAEPAPQRPTTEVNQAPPARAQSPSPPRERSLRPPASPPPSPPESPPESPPAPTLPPLPEEPEPAVDPIADLPIAEGTVPPLESAPPSSPPPPAEQLQNATAYQYDGRKSLKPGEAYEALINWVAADQILPENVAPIELPYQLGETCLDPPPESGLLAVILDETGNFVRGPEVIDSTGYPLLDEQATAIAGDHPFPDRSEPLGYVAEIVVQYPAACL